MVFAGLSLIHMAYSFAGRAPLVAVEGTDGLALLAGLGLLIIAAACLTPAPDLRSGRTGSRGGGVARRLMIVAAAVLVASPFGPTLVRAAAEAGASRGGYIRCPRVANVRRQPDRWRLAGRNDVACPTAGP